MGKWLDALRSQNETEKTGGDGVTKLPKLSFESFEGGVPPVSSNTKSEGEARTTHTRDSKPCPTCGCCELWRDRTTGEWSCGYCTPPTDRSQPDAWKLTPASWTLTEAGVEEPPARPTAEGEVDPEIRRAGIAGQYGLTVDQLEEAFGEDWDAVKEDFTVLEAVAKALTQPSPGRGPQGKAVRCMDCLYFKHGNCALFEIHGLRRDVKHWCRHFEKK